MKAWSHAINGYVSDVRSPHVGYINLIPFVLEFYPTPDSRPTNKPAWISNILPNIISLVSSESNLFGSSGLRSLSKSDPLYHTGDNYWRGHVWVNINYLFLKSLREYYLPKFGCVHPMDSCRSPIGQQLVQ